MLSPSQPIIKQLPLNESGLCRRRVLLSILFAAVVWAAGSPADAGAAPAYYRAVPGSVGQPIFELEAGPDETLWAEQQGEGDTGRVLHLDGSGNVLGATPFEQGLGQGLTQLAPSGSGAWAATGPRTLEHIAPDGAESEVSLPVEGLLAPQTLVAGGDGRGWLLSCRRATSSEGCDAVAISPDGEAEAFPLPAMELEWPSGADGSWKSSAVVSESGVWFEKVLRIGGGPVESRLGYVSYSGEVSTVAVPAGAEAIASAGPGALWWLRDEGIAGASVGRVDIAGNIADTRHLASLSENEDLAGWKAGPGRDDSMLWAQNATWNDSYDGQIGELGVGGTGREYKVPTGATYLPTTTPHFWSGNCNFGVRLYEAVDGSLWTITGGHPGRVTRQQPSGTFETYALGGIASAFTGEGESGIWGMVETNPRALYFSLSTPTGPEIARVDPLDPPPAAPRYADDLGSDSEEEAGVGLQSSRRPAEAASATSDRIDVFLAALLRQVRRSLQRPGGKVRVLDVALPEAGRAGVQLSRWSDGGWARPISTTISGGPGPHPLRLRVGQSVGTSSADSPSRFEITVRFRPAHGVWASRSAVVNPHAGGSKAAASSGRGAPTAEPGLPAPGSGRHHRAVREG